MRIVLWDTRQLDVSKDFAGGMGVGKYPGGGGWRGKIIRYMYQRDRRPVALAYSYLAAIFRKLGHEVEYSEDDIPVGADLYVFNPALISLDLERRAMEQVLAQSPRPRVLVTGLVAYTLPDAFAHLDVKIVKGEAEQLLWKLDEVLASTERVVEVGSVKNLDDLPWPDWSLFEPHRFRIAYDFTRFPTGLVQQSRGCTFTCNYCPYIVVENKTRFRDPEQIAGEMRRGIEQYGFRSFKFRDPLFGLDRKRALALAEQIGRLPRKVEFSIESRIDLLKTDTLKALREVGLTSITVGIETPNEDTLRQYKRAPIRDDRQREFVALCRGMGIRTVAGFMIGFPEDNVKSIHAVLRYAKAVNPTYANFNIVTPYPGTEFFSQVKDQIANFDYTKYTVYTPVMKYRNMTADEVARQHARCFTSYYFRWEYLRDNAHLMWPSLQRLGIGMAPAASEAPITPTSGHEQPPAPKSGLEILQQSADLRKDGPHRRPAGAEQVNRKVGDQGK